jgi:hypothetical protein
VLYTFGKKENIIYFNILRSFSKKIQSLKKDNKTLRGARADGHYLLNFKNI